MAILGFVGFETRQAQVDGITITGTAAISQTQARTGTSSMRINPASGANGKYDIVGGNLSGYLHFGLYVASAPTLTRFIVGGPINIGLALRSTGALEYFSSGVSEGTSAVLSAGWHWIGVRQTAGTSVAVVQIDGVDAITGTGQTINSYGMGCTQSEASAIDIYFDDHIINSTGFLASSKVALLVPISDNANTSWTRGAGVTTTGLFNPVATVPPPGVASASETDSTNIESAASTGTANYIANLTTYTTAGVGASDTVLAVQTLVQHGEDISTGTKTGSFEITANPTITATTFTFGADAGAHGATPTTWTSAKGTITNLPSVTLGSSPTMKVVKTDTTTRTACVDFMGAYMAWTPAAAAGALPARPLFVRQAVNRSTL